MLISALQKREKKVVFSLVLKKMKDLGFLCSEAACCNLPPNQIHNPSVSHLTEGMCEAIYSCYNNYCSSLFYYK